MGSSRRGIADPIMAGDVKKDNLGVGAQNPGEVNPDDDIYEQYKKRMMLGYRHRPNPLVITRVLFSPLSSFLCAFTNDSVLLCMFKSSLNFPLYTF